MNLSRTLLPALALALATTAPVAASAATVAPSAADRQPLLTLPEPTGRHDVSTATRWLVDRSRQDPWRAGPRRLVVTLTYPARGAHGPAARYLTRAESAAYLDFQAEQGQPVPDVVPRDVLARVDTGATRGDRAAAGRHRPLVLLSPGFSLPRATLTALATDLASHGYVVASVDHVGESTGVTLRNGRLVRCAACDVEDYATVPRVRADDLSFVVDTLLGEREDARIAVVGHSIGGNAASSTMQQDPRVDAGVDLDGTFFDPVAERIDRPFLMMGTRELHTPGGDDESWDETWPRLTGERWWLTVAGSVHFSFTDLPQLVDQAGLPGAQALEGERGTEITRAYVRAFLDRTLRHRSGALLDGPSAAYPEVRSERDR